MAVKKSLLGGYTFQDLFDTQNALEKGNLSETQAGTETWSESSSGILGMGSAEIGGTKKLIGNKENLGSILGYTSEIAANKKRRLEQEGAGSQGQGRSILGGSSF